MENQIQEISGTQQPRADGVSLQPYIKPELKVYGTVRDLTLGTGTVNGDSGSLSMATGGSDPALKQDIVRIGTHPLGFGLYLFTYKEEFRDFCPAGRQFGVMADEVEKVMPEAVCIENGFKAVRYSMLGIDRAPSLVH